MADSEQLQTSTRCQWPIDERGLTRRVVHDVVEGERLGMIAIELVGISIEILRRVGYASFRLDHLPVAHVQSGAEVIIRCSRHENIS